MPSTIDTEVPAASRKLDKKSKKEKKRARDEEESTTPRKHKRSKSEAVPAVGVLEQNEDEEAVKPKKDKKKKHKKSKDGAGPLAPEPEPAETEVVPETPLKSKKSKKEKRRAKEGAEEQPEAVGEPEEGAVTEVPQMKKRPRRKAQADETAQRPQPQDARDDSGEPGGDCMDVDDDTAVQAPGGVLQPAHAPADPEFPFVTQTVSLYVPLFPSGFDQPLTKVAEQHLKPLLNHYSPLLKGVLLDYRHVTLAETPTRADPRAPPTDRTPTVLACRDEYAVGFGWLTAEVYLFVPRRGAWMEGTVNLHSEGHLGVVCWGRFNASLEARRVPRSWRFVDVVQRAEDAKKARFRNAGKKAAAADDATETSSQVNGQEGPNNNNNNEEEAPEDLENSLQQMHATGYWVDAEGRRVQGKLRFRIKNYDVGTAGDHGYISIEGTMLDEDAERALLAKEKERERARRVRNNRSGMLTREMRPVPKFSVTNFGPEDDEDDGPKKQPMYFASRPGTPDD
ncbi:hypothetical protein RB595_005003 [Gaeumannomyces hyphopodioides]